MQDPSISTKLLEQAPVLAVFTIALGFVIRAFLEEIRSARREHAKQDEARETRCEKTLVALNERVKESLDRNSTALDRLRDRIEERE